MIVNRDDLLEALDRIARTPDGQALYLYLQWIAQTIPEAPDPSDGALRANFGRRSLALELMARMGKGIEESGRSSSRDSPVIFRAPAGGAANKRLTARERIARSDPELAALTVQSAGDDTSSGPGTD